MPSRPEHVDFVSAGEQAPTANGSLEKAKQAAAALRRRVAA